MWLLRLPGLVRVLERFGVLCRWRAGMTLDLSRLQERPRLPLGYEIVPWDGMRLREVALADHEAYLGTVDAHLYWQYFSTPAGCERMWREAISGRFGGFSPEHTRLLMHEGHICGNVMSSLRSPSDGFIGNLSVVPEHRGGTGTALLLEALWSFKNAGVRRVSLAVTLDNRRAYHLYERLGFEIHGEFPLVVRPRGGIFITAG